MSNLRRIVLVRHGETVGNSSLRFHGSSDVALSDEGREQMRAATWDGTDTPVYNIPVALSIMVFFALCAQCAATLAVIRRETNSWRWPLFTFAYMTGLAYVAAFVTYQVGMMV